MSPFVIIFPLISAAIYAVGAMLVKRAMESGIGPWRTTFACNLAMALVQQPCWIFATQPFAWNHAAHAMLAGTTFFIGQVFTFLALNRGDVSVATPVLGTKVIFVAGLTIAMLGDRVQPSWWVAVILTVVGTALLSYNPKSHPRHVALSIGFGLIAASSFALTDILVQKWARLWSFGNFVPVMFATVGVLSFSFVPLFSGKLLALPARTWRWLAPGATLLAVQALGMAFAISTYGHATVVNIAYNSRGMWTILLVWTVGHWFGNTERDQGHGVMARRLVGAALLVTAIALVSLK
jgi:drug/metabolite transporter (DMT)-like permease